MKRTILTILFSTSILAASALGEEKQTFSYKWKTGKKYTQLTKMEQEMNVLGQGEMKMNMEMEITSVPKPGKKEGTTDVLVTYESFKVSGEMGGSPIPGMEGAAEKFVGKSVTATFGKDGAITDVSGLEKLIGDDPELKQMLNKDQVKQTMAQANLMGLPPKPVGPGESWDIEVSYPVPMMDVAIKGKYTYEKDEEIEGVKCAKLLLDAKLLMSPKKPASDEDADADEDPEIKQQKEAMEAMGMKISESEMLGVTYYDLKLQTVKKFSMDMKLTMSMKNPATGEAMEIPTKTKMEMTQTVQDIE